MDEKPTRVEHLPRVSTANAADAAAEPANTNYFYYVLIDSDGTHGFSETLEEHNRKKQEAKDAGVLTP